MSVNSKPVAPSTPLTLPAFNEQLRSIQQGIAAQFGGGGPQSSSEPDELFSPNESEEEQDDSKTQIAECGEQEQNAIEIKSEGEESGGDDFRRRGNYVISKSPIFQCSSEFSSTAPDGFRPPHRRLTVRQR